MLDWLMSKIGYVPQEDYDSELRASAEFRNLWNSERNENNKLTVRVSRLEKDVEEKDEALSYLPRRFRVELGEASIDDGKMWMPAGVNVSVEFDPETHDFHVMRAYFDCHLSYNIAMNHFDTTAYASAAVEQMAKSLARAVEYKLIGDGMNVLAKYFKEKDKEYVTRSG